MGLLTSPGGLSGLASGPSRGLDIREDKIDTKLADLDTPIEEAKEKLKIGEANQQLKNDTLKKLMRRLRTSNTGLVLSEMENKYNWDNLDSVLEISDQDINEMANNIRFSMVDLIEDTPRVSTVMQRDPNISALLDPTAGGAKTPFGGKITGAAPTIEETFKLKARQQGTTFEDVRDTLAFRGIESGIPRDVLPSGVITDAFGRKTGDPNFDESTAYEASTQKAFSNIPASRGDRVYTFNRQFGYEDNVTDRRAANEFVEDRIATYFGFMPSRTIDGSLIEPTEGSETANKEKFAFTSTIVGEVRGIANSIINQSGEISGSLLEKIADDAYNSFYGLMDNHSRKWNALGNDEKNEYAKKNNLSQKQVSRLNNFAVAFANNTYDATGNYLPGAGKAQTYNMYNLSPGEKRDTSTRVRVAQFRDNTGRISIVFNNGDIETGNPQDPNIAPYL